MEQKARVQREKQELQAKVADYQTPEWAKVEGEDDLFTDEEEEGEEIEEVNEFYCVVCEKAYRSEKQFTSHESSKRHIENVEILRQEMLADEEDFEFGGEDAAEIVDPGTPLDQVAAQMDDLELVEEEEESMSSKKNKKKSKKKAAPNWGYDEEDVPENLDDVSVLAAALEEERSRRRRKGGQRDLSPQPQPIATTDTPPTTTTADSSVTETSEAPQEKESAKTKREKRKEKKKAKEENELTEVNQTRFLLTL
jgi:DnaJ family protein A protein 5